MAIPFQPLKFLPNQVVSSSWWSLKPHSNLIAAISSGDTAGRFWTDVSFTLLLLSRTNSSLAPQPLYSMTLLGSWETRTAPVASCEFNEDSLSFWPRCKKKLESLRFQTCSFSTTSCTEVPLALPFTFTIARGCFWKCALIAFATPVTTLLLPKK